MKKYAELTPEEQKAEDQTIFVVDSTELDVSNPIVLQLPAAIMLSGHTSLIGVYSQLILLNNQKLLDGATQEQLADFMNLALPTFNDYRNALIEIKAIRLVTSKHNHRVKEIRLNSVTPIIKADLEKRFRTHGKEFIWKWLLEMRTKIKGITPDEMTEAIKQQEAIQQQKQSQLFIQGEAKKIVQKEKQAAKAKIQKFPQHDYISVIDSYKKAKGVFLKPHSPDELRVRRSIKLMFLSGHSVSDIIACMLFFQIHCRKEGYDWMIHWTIETIAKKMPEFKAGRLKLPEIGDDLPPM